MICAAHVIVQHALICGTSTGTISDIYSLKICAAHVLVQHALIGAHQLEQF